MSRNSSVLTGRRASTNSNTVTCTSTARINHYVIHSHFDFYSACNESQFQCFDGKTCIHKLQYCDMYLDCPDKSLCNTFTFWLIQPVMSRNSSVLTGRRASTNSNTVTCISTARINHYVIHSRFDFYSACNESHYVHVIHSHFDFIQVVMSRNSSVLTARRASTNSNTATCISTARINHYVIHSHFDFIQPVMSCNSSVLTGRRASTNSNTVTCISTARINHYVHVIHSHSDFYSACNESQFQCFDGKTCIHKLQYCDMYLDCPDKSLCTCNTFLFWLFQPVMRGNSSVLTGRRASTNSNTATCISTVRINLYVHVIHSHFDFYSACNESQFQCFDGKTCIHKLQYCDMYLDCPDKSLCTCNTFLFWLFQPVMRGNSSVLTGRRASTNSNTVTCTSTARINHYVIHSHFDFIQHVMSRSFSVLTGRGASTNSNTATCISTARINHYVHVIHSHFDFYSACNESQFQCFDGKTCIHKLQYCYMYLDCPDKSLCTCNTFTFWLLFSM